MKETYEVITWPDIQYFMDIPGFRENSYLINDPKGLDDFGSSAYFVNSEWLKKINNGEAHDTNCRG